MFCIYHYYMILSISCVYYIYLNLTCMLFYCIGSEKIGKLIDKRIKVVWIFFVINKR